MSEKEKKSPETKAASFAEIATKAKLVDKPKQETISAVAQPADRGGIFHPRSMSVFADEVAKLVIQRLPKFPQSRKKNRLLLFPNKQQEDISLIPPQLLTEEFLISSKQNCSVVPSWCWIAYCWNSNILQTPKIR